MFTALLGLIHANIILILIVAGCLSYIIYDTIKHHRERKAYDEGFAAGRFSYPLWPPNPYNDFMLTHEWYRGLRAGRRSREAHFQTDFGAMS